MTDFAGALTYSVHSLAHARRAVAVEQSTLAYSASDFVVGEHTDNDGRVLWSKELTLSGGFSLAAAVSREDSSSENGGLGLFVRMADDPGFSWEWFAPQGPDSDIFQKIQGDGRLQVSYFDDGLHRELVAVRFLDAIALRYFEGGTDVRVDISGDVVVDTHTHEVIVTPGSELRVSALTTRCS